jgi:hypothetical protein
MEERHSSTWKSCWADLAEMQHEHDFALIRLICDKTINSLKNMGRRKRMGEDNLDRPAPKISTLKRREIQSPLLACVLDGFIGEIGYEKAMQVASAAIQKDAAQVGKMMAEKYGGNSTRELMRMVKEVWAEEGALEITILEDTGQTLSFDVTRCQYAEMYDRLGIKGFGCCFSCNRDESLIRGFNPRMQLRRTQTIMQGATSCDFRIMLE